MIKMDLKECHSTIEVDLPITKKEMQREVMNNRAMGMKAL